MRRRPNMGSRLAHLIFPLARLQAAPARRGQSMVEFALVFPLLLVLFLGVADFGRVFSAGIITEGLTRDAAEIVANDARMAKLKDPSCDDACRAPIYAALHMRAAQVACDEAQRLAPSTDTSGGSCAGRLLVSVCIRDAATADGDPYCGQEDTGGTFPSGGACAVLTTGWDPAQNGIAALAADGTADVPLRQVEVRTCYRFTPLYRALGIPLISYLVPDIYLQRARTFTVSSDY